VAEQRDQHVNCPGCGRDVSAHALSCLYCKVDLNLPARNNPSEAPGDDDAAARCALCGRTYQAMSHPAGCPHCADEFADPIRREEAIAKQRRGSVRLLSQAAVAGVALLIGYYVHDLADTAMPTFSENGTGKPVIATALLISSMLAWRAYDSATLKDATPLVEAAVTGIVAFAGFAPWCALMVLWANGFGITSPDVTVGCVVQSIEPDAGGARYDMMCRLDDDTQLSGTIHASASGVRKGMRIAQPMRKGRLGYYVSATELRSE
jgi:hypothetical protein